MPMKRRRSGLGHFQALGTIYCPEGFPRGVPGEFGRPKQASKQASKTTEIIFVTVSCFVYAVCCFLFTYLSLRSKVGVTGGDLSGVAEGRYDVLQSRVLEK